MLAKISWHWDWAFYPFNNEILFGLLHRLLLIRVEVLLDLKILLHDSLVVFLHHHHGKFIILILRWDYWHRSHWHNLHSWMHGVHSWHRMHTWHPLHRHSLYGYSLHVHFGPLLELLLHSQNFHLFFVAHWLHGRYNLLWVGHIHWRWEIGRWLLSHLRSILRLLLFLLRFLYFFYLLLCFFIKLHGFWFVFLFGEVPLFVGWLVFLLLLWPPLLYESFKF